MIYVDTSVVLAQLLAEDRYPDPEFWRQSLFSSRLLEYETWTRVHSRGLSKTHAEPLRQILDRIAFLELAPPVLARALDPFPVPVRTLDAIHLASIEFLRGQHQQVTLATYDRRMNQAAHRMRITTIEP